MPVRIGVDPKRVAAIVFLFFLQFGLVSLFVVQDTVIGQKAATGLILLGIACIPVLARSNFPMNRLADAFPALLLAVIVIASFLSNQVIFHYGYGNWLGYTYIMVPLLVYYAFWAFSITAAEILTSFIFMGILAATIVCLDSVVHISALDAIQRFTNDSGVRRVPILKNECVLAFCLIFAAFYTRSVPRNRTFLYLYGAAVTVYVIMFRFESRIALAALLLSLVIYLLSRRVTAMRQVFYLVMGFLLGLPAIYVGLQKYIDPIFNQGLSDYIANQNVEIRFLSNAYFYGYFEKTGGIGFGLMTLNQDVSNFQSAGVPRSFGIADLGMFGALYEYGWVGLAMVVVASLAMVYVFYRIGLRRIHPRHDWFLMVGAYVLGFMLQPIPMNFFTLNWTALIGGTLWYLMRRSAWETAQLAPADRVRRPPAQPRGGMPRRGPALAAGGRLPPR